MVSEGAPALSRRTSRKLPESSSLLKHSDRVGFWSGMWIKACEALAERLSAG
jgi:hypothetical protein